MTAPPPKRKSSRRPPPAAAFSSTSGRTGPVDTYREDNPNGSFRVEDDSAVEGVAHGSLPDYTPVFGLAGYSGVDSGDGRSGILRRRRFSLGPAPCERCHKFLTVGLAAALVAVIVAGRRGKLALQSYSHSGKSCSDAGSGGWAALPPSVSSITSVAFGSCADQDLPQPHWDTLALMDPDITILMGDNVYGDCDDDTCTGLRRAYDQLADHPSFIGARQRLPMVATLDDHDYGKGSFSSLDVPHSGYSHADDGGDKDEDDDTASDAHNLDGGDAGGANALNPHKDVAKSLFLDFFGVPANDERRLRKGDGVYTSYEWGPPGRRLQLILLDARYARSEFKSTGNSSAPHDPHELDDEDARMLSEDQWMWLTNLLDRPADVRLVVSSVQVIADGHSFECWRMIPRERNRLYALLKRRAQESRILLLSGDRLVGGFYEHDSTGLKEITSSSFTHSLPYGALPPCSEKDAMADDYDWEQCDEKDPRRIGGFVHENNIGWIEIDWDKRTVNVSLRMANTYPAHVHGSKKRVRGVKNAGTVLMDRTYDIPTKEGSRN